jgi:hypothetical protein
MVDVLWCRTSYHKTDYCRKCVFFILLVVAMPDFQLFPNLRHTQCSALLQAAYPTTLTTLEDKDMGSGKDV